MANIDKIKRDLEKHHITLKITPKGLQAEQSGKVMAIYGFKEVEDAFKEVGIKPPTKEE
jgi:hypothetical protein